MKVLAILDERWDSALTQLGLTVAKLLPCRVACAVLKGSPAERKAREFGFELYYIEDPRKGLPFRAFFSTLRVIASCRPDAVLTIRGDEMLFSALVKNRFGFKLFRIHGSAAGIKNTFLNRMLHRKFVDGVIVSSRRLLNDVVAGLPRLFIPGIVDVRAFRFSPGGRERIRRELGVGKSRLIGVIGRLDPVKGHLLFLKAFAEVLKRREDVLALILGEEKNVTLDRLKREAFGLGILDKVIFITERRPDIADIMSAVDLGVVPSVGSEVVLRVPLEFMACRTPVVSTDVGALPEVIAPPYGMAVPPDPRRLSRAILKFLSTNLDMASRAAEEVVREKYSEEVLAPVVSRFILGRLQERNR